MYKLSCIIGFLLLICLSASGSLPRPRPGPGADGEAVASAVARGLTLVQKAAENYPKHRNCFSCHHQTLPMLAMVNARKCGQTIDEPLLQAQAEFSHQSFRDNHEDLRAGRGVGGRAMTVAYALWALKLAEWKPDETTAALVGYLLKTQHTDGYWTGQAVRPPLEESYFMATALAAQGMKRYATAEKRADVTASLDKAQRWLATAPVRTQEDRNARLWGLALLDGMADALQTARDAVVKAQCEDGGWSQTDELASDAYSTGQTLYVLRTTGIAASDPVYQRGVEFLLKTQCSDGSWHVKTRSKPIQKEFDNGDPHGKDQFISTPASCWAIAALAQSLPAKSADPDKN
jgi:N-acyl-D-amino-acid deacylase